MPTVFLVPSFIAENAINTIPPYVLDAVKECNVIFAENIRTTRRFLKSIDKEINIDNFEWFEIHKSEIEHLSDFKKKVSENKNIAIISEAGCPGIADPGQKLVEIAQKAGCSIKPLVGPSSILLALMASGMNGQQFEFVGYLPVDQLERENRLRELENASSKNLSSKIFIETPYRNDKLFESIIKTCRPDTLLCIAKNITGKNEFIKTKPVAEWKKDIPSLHKQTVVFIIYAGF